MCVSMLMCLIFQTVPPQQRAYFLIFLKASHLDFRNETSSTKFKIVFKYKFEL